MMENEVIDSLDSPPDLLFQKYMDTRMVNKVKDRSASKE